MQSVLMNLDAYVNFTHRDIINGERAEVREGRREKTHSDSVLERTRSIPTTHDGNIALCLHLSCRRRVHARTYSKPGAKNTSGERPSLTWLHSARVFSLLPSADTGRRAWAAVHGR